MDAGHAPENSTAELRRFAPETVLLIDAAAMDEPPGTIRCIDMEEMDGMSASTHSLPLSLLARYLTLDLKCEVTLLGIQPQSNDVGEGLTLPVLQSVREITELITGSLFAREPVG
jgi:hydrogenase 3 maturation protease